MLSHRPLTLTQPGGTDAPAAPATQLAAEQVARAPTSEVGSRGCDGAEPDRTIQLCGGPPLLTFMQQVSALRPPIPTGQVTRDRSRSPPPGLPNPADQFYNMVLQGRSAQESVMVDDIFERMVGWSNAQLAEAALMWVNMGVLRVEPDHRQITLLRDTHGPLPTPGAPAAVRYQGLRPYLPSQQVGAVNPSTAAGNEGQARPSLTPPAGQQQGSYPAAQDGRGSR